MPANIQSNMYPLIYWLPITITPLSFVNIASTASAAISMMTITIIPYTVVIIVAYLSVFSALSGLPAPIFCADRADTAASIEDGTINRALITFSTIPTAAASVIPL